jgi:hypothetical protein
MGMRKRMEWMWTPASEKGELQKENEANGAENEMEVDNNE